MSNDALRALFGEMVEVLAPLVDMAQQPQDLTQLLTDLGWTVASVPSPLLELATAGADLIDALGEDETTLTAEQVLAAIAQLIGAITSIVTKPDSAFPTSVDVASFKATIGRDLLDYCVVEHALRRRYRVGRLLKLAGIVQLVEQPALGLRQAYLQRHVEWSRIGTLLTNPVSGFRQVYAWDTANAQLKHLLSDIAGVFEAFGLALTYFKLTPAQLAFANAAALQPLAFDQGISLVLDQALGVPPGGSAGIQLLARPATAQRGPALAVLPYAKLATPATRNNGDEADVSVSVSGDADLTQGLAITLAPGHAPTVDAGFLSGSTAATPSQFALTVKVPPAPGSPDRVLLGTVDGSRVSLHTFVATGGLAVASGQPLDAFIEIELDRLHVAIKPDADSDSFLASLLGPNGVAADLTLGIRLSTLTGFHLTGAAGLETTVPISVQFGPVALRGISFALRPNAQGFDIDVGATVNASIGPVTAVADAVGFGLVTSFPDPPKGNLGPIDLSFGFKPPSGIGLSIDAGGVVTGGGFLFHDAVQSVYAGVMQLSLNDAISLNAYGLIATKLPDGSPGYSMLVFITAEDFQAIPLGMGFTLLGIGGMVAINRTFDQDVLRQGLKNDTLGALLFPRDPVGNAPALIRALAAAFPARGGSYLLGVLAKIGWFTPTLVLLELALILEFGARKRLLVLGRISSILPSPDNDLIRLVMDAIGVLDFDQSTASIDAVLVDSRLARTYALTGAMALRANWGSGPGSTFVLAVGGLHPQFLPPADLPKLDRIAIALSSGDNPRMVCQAYFAITANTVQFGASASLYASAYGFSVEGDIGYDVLLQIAPLHFIADFNAKLELKHGSTSLFSVSLDGELEGPRPLRVSGSAAFEIFWCSFTIRFDATLVDGEQPPAPAAIDLTGQLAAALQAPSSWSVQTPFTHGVALKKLDASSTLVLDPLGLLVVKQQVVPLNTTRDIDLYGGAPVAGARRFALTASLQGDLQGPNPVTAPFAPAQFFAMSDDEKLAAPSFEVMDAGIVIGDAAVRFGDIVGAPLEYESIVVDTMPQPSTQPDRYTLLSDMLMNLSVGGAAAKSPVRSVGPQRFAQSGIAPAATLEPLIWTIQPLADGPAPPPAPPSSTWSALHASLAGLNRAQANWQMVPAHELTA